MTNWNYFVQVPYLSNVKPFLDGKPDTSEYISCVHNPQELIFRCCLMKESHFLINKEGIRDPDQFDVFSSNNQFVKIRSFVKCQSWILPELSEVHAKGKIHELLRGIIIERI